MTIDEIQSLLSTRKLCRGHAWSFGWVRTRTEKRIWISKHGFGLRFGFPVELMTSFWNVAREKCNKIQDEAIRQSFRPRRCCEVGVLATFSFWFDHSQECGTFKCSME